MLAAFLAKVMLNDLGTSGLGRFSKSKGLGIQDYMKFVPISVPGSCSYHLNAGLFGHWRRYLIGYKNRCFKLQRNIAKVIQERELPDLILEATRNRK